MQHGISMGRHSEAVSLWDAMSGQPIPFKVMVTIPKFLGMESAPTDSTPTSPLKRRSRPLTTIVKEGAENEEPVSPSKSHRSMSKTAPISERLTGGQARIRNIAPVARAGHTEVSRGIKKPRNAAAFAIFGACVARAVWHQACALVNL